MAGTEKNFILPSWEMLVTEPGSVCMQGRYLTLSCSLCLDPLFHYVTLALFCIPSKATPGHLQCRVLCLYLQQLAILASCWQADASAFIPHAHSNGKKFTAKQSYCDMQGFLQEASSTRNNKTAKRSHTHTPWCLTPGRVGHLLQCFHKTKQREAYAIPH